MARPSSRASSAGSPGSNATDGDEWGAISREEALDRLSVDPERGLSQSEADQRRSDVGPNRIDAVESEPAWRLFVDQFRNALILLLLGAAVVAGVVGAVRDSIVIVFVLTLNAVIGFVQEYRAQKSMAELRKMLRFSATVRRDGSESEIDGADLVPGDIVLLADGDRVPADGRLVGGESVSANESSLTGESTTVDKTTDPTEPGAPLAERSSDVFMGTSIARGNATVLVTATGVDTQMGQLSERMHRQEDRASPLETSLSVLANRLSILAIAAATAVVGLGLLRGEGLNDALIDGVVLAVASIPEGLPAIVTVTLALGMRAMAKRGALIDDLQAIHTLGATTVVCTDKTGTLTLNRMTVRVLDTPRGVYELDGDGDGDGDELPRSAIEIVALCNDAELDGDESSGDPTEVAMLALADRSSMDRRRMADETPRIAEVPFSSERMYMATFHRADPDEGDDITVLVKGAPSVVIERCSTIASDDGGEVLEDEGRQGLGQRTEELASEGYRVLALARTSVSDVTDDLDERMQLIDGLRFEGFVAMEDPPRAEAADTIEQFHRAGIAVKMVTGDNAETARAIAERLGIGGDTLSGPELAELSEDQLGERLEHVGVLARVEPTHKVDVVDALAARGHVIAMTGDGVNDAVALQRADVGVAMGERGAEVAKEAGDVILTDDRLETILDAIRRGRSIYDNIITFVRFNLATNLGAMLTILVAKALDLPTPFTPLQVLWVNLIMDGPPAMALGADPPADDVMERPPRDPSARILSGPRAVAIAAMGVWMAAGTLLVFTYGRNTDSDEKAVALAFTTFVLFQIVNALNVRTGLATVFSRRTFTNPMLWAAIAIVLTLQVVVVEVSAVSDLFETQPLSVTEWTLAVAVAVSIVPISEVVRLGIRLRNR